jgi:hypothetical protein
MKDGEPIFSAIDVFVHQHRHCSTRYIYSG